MSLVNRTMYPVQTGMSQITKMQERFATLQVQLATGQKASTLAGLGADRYVDLSIRNRLGKIEGYKNSIDMVSTRLGLMEQVVTQLDKLESETRGNMTRSVYGTSNINFGTAPSLAQTRLSDVLTLLNTDADGRYLFAGADADSKPVAGMNAILEGSGGKAGFRQVAAERQAADVGDGMGRLGASTAGATVTLAEDGDHPFGFKLSTVTASNLASVTPTLTAGPPASAAVDFIAQPAAGDSVTIGLKLPDGSEASVKLTATTNDPPGAGEFLIGADADATAANFETALGGALTSLAGTELVAASNFAAAENFFNGNGEPILRVAGPGFATATALVTADPTTTVSWYKGGSAADPRGSVSSRIDEAATVRYGAQANESGIVSLVRTLAVQAIQSFPTTDATATGRYDAIATRSNDMLSESRNSEPGSIEMVAVELGMARASASRIADSHTSYKAQLDNMLSDIETVSKEDVAMEILALQTRLQASYQATAMIAQLSLVNYL
jgi:flagellar hook-associated protein FlgK